MKDKAPEIYDLFTEKEFMLIQIDAFLFVCYSSLVILSVYLLIFKWNQSKILESIVWGSSIKEKIVHK